MTCPRCQAETDAGARYCEDCGARLEAACPSCGALVTPGKRFCRACGAALTTEPAGRFASAESYTPKHLAEKILTSRGALEGERKQVTVLFADLKGSMELLADRDPEEARKLLDPVLEHMMEGVHRYEGTVNQVMGDGIMALFGAPLAHEDHAVRACYAALRMQEAVARYAETVFRSHGVPLQIRVGLNSGEVVVRAIGSDLHMDYTAVGQTTHLAARMEQMATPGTILLAHATLQLAEGHVQVAARGPVAVKGLPDPVEIYVLTGASASRTRLHAAASRGLTRFVGRDAEIEQIRQALALADEGRGQLVALVGEPGVGKSRLLYEFTHSYRTREWLVLEAGSMSYGKAFSYLPIIELLKAYFKIHDREAHREIREKVTGKLLTLDESLRPALPALLALLDVPVLDTAWQALDPAQRRQRTLEAVKHLLLRESQAQPLLVVFEDLHWIDGETQTLLDSLIDSLAAARLLLLVNYRPEYQHAWGGKTYYRQLRIDPLPPESIDEMLEALLGPDALLGPLKRLLVHRTEANPLFLEESVRTLVETGALTGERGAYRLTRPVDQLTMPATVQAILAARIDRLAPGAKRLLQAAAVVGKEVPMPLLLAIADVPEHEVRTELTSLQAAEFLYETRLFPDLEYTFKHALTHEVAYGGVLHDRRRAVHAQIVDAVEALHRERLGEHAERLAHHAFRGGVWEKAVRYGREAAAKALGRSANREAAAFMEQALEAAARLPEGRPAREVAVDLRLELYATLLPLDQLRPLLDRLREAETLAAALEDRERLGWARLHICHIGGLVDDVREMAELADNVMALAQGLGNQRMEADACLWAGCWAYALGRHRSAVEFLRKGIDVRTVRRPGQPVREVGRSGYLAMFLAELGEFREARHEADITLRARETIAGHPWNLVNASWQTAWAHALWGDLETARQLAQQAVDVCRHWGFSRSLGAATSVLGRVFVLSGRAAEAIDLLEEGLRRTDAVGMMWLRCPRVADLAEAYLRTGRVRDAVARGGEALECARGRGERGFEAWALRLQAEIALAATPSDTEVAEQHYRAALTLADELGMRPLAAHCHLGLGRLFQRTGGLEHARAHLTAATMMYREMEMTYWPEQARAEMRELA
jgi:class 3 adenylate cyclase/tetratricopeptide (TPR) repeat protein